MAIDSQPKPFGSFRIFLNVFTHCIAVAVFGIVLYDQKSQGHDVCCGYKTRGLHPVAMVFAFAWLGPWGAIAYKTYETMLGISHTKAKVVHAILQTLALSFGWFGFVSKYESKTMHFGSLHSQLGIAVLALYSLQWFVGVGTFLFACVPQSLKKKIASGHAFAGATSMILSFGAIFTGIVSYTGFVTDANRASFDRQNTAAFLTIILGVLVINILGSSRSRNALHNSERIQLLNDAKTKSNKGGGYQVMG